MTREATDKICVGSVFPICSFEHMWFMTVHIIIITNTQVARVVDVILIIFNFNTTPNNRSLKKKEKRKHSRRRRSHAVRHL